MFNMLLRRKRRRTTASELSWCTVRIRVDFLVGCQCNQKQTTCAPVLPRHIKIFHFVTILATTEVFTISITGYDIIAHYMLYSHSDHFPNHTSVCHYLYMVQLLYISAWFDVKKLNGFL